MNWHRIEGDWKQFKGGVREQWDMLTDDQVALRLYMHGQRATGACGKPIFHQTEGNKNELGPH